MSSSSIMIDLDDERSSKIAEVLSNKTSKKILQALAEDEKSASDVAAVLNLPLNTITYNLKKLTEAGLVERSKGFFWSRKGKKMELYKVANKRIVIMPKQMAKGVLPAIIMTGIVALGIRFWTKGKIAGSEAVDNLARSGEGVLKIASDGALQATNEADVVPTAAYAASNYINEAILTIAQSAWLWFFVGALFALLVYLVWNWGKR